MAGALAARHTDKELEKGRVERTTVKRYWPGKAPDWAGTRTEDAALPTEEAITQQVQRTAISAPVVVKKVADPRLARLQQQTKVSRDEAQQEHRQVRAAEVVRRRRRDRASADEAASSSSGSSDDDSSSSGDESAEEQQQQQDDEVDEVELQKRRDALKQRYGCG